MTRIAAAALGFIAVGHTVIVLAAFGAPFFAMLGEGWWNTVGAAADRLAVFWSLYFGFALGLAALAVGRSRVGPWALATLGVTGGLAIPVSGFWLALPAAWAWSRALRQERD